MARVVSGTDTVTVPHHALDLCGDTLMEIVLDGAPAPVSPEEIEEWKSTPATTRFTQGAATWISAAFPK
jgi:hypothetical protein